MARFASKLCAISLLCATLLWQEQGWAADTPPVGTNAAGAESRTADQDAFNAGRLQGILEGVLGFKEELRNYKIAVNIDDRTAVLTGAVANQAHKDLAGDIAREMDGIEAVDNRLSIDPALADAPSAAAPGKAPKPAADDDPDVAGEESLQQDRNFAQFAKDLSTTASIKARLMAHELVDGLAIKVETYQGRVTLSGQAESQVEKDLAEFVARKKGEIAHLENRIVITRP